MPFLLGILATVGVIVLAGAVVVWSGAYNFAATDPHSPAFRSVIDAALHQSVAERAADLQAPASFTPEQIRSGAQEFMEYCVHCHGAPGVKPHEWTTGMSPNPPALSRAATQWSTAEIFWIVKHGIKMTGMPPFGDSESDRTIWNIAGFVERLPSMSPQQYAKLKQSLSAESGNGGGHGHGSGEGHSH